MIRGAVNVMTQELQQPLDLLQCWLFPDALLGGMQKVLYSMAHPQRTEIFLGKAWYLPTEDRETIKLQSIPVAAQLINSSIEHKCKLSLTLFIRLVSLLLGWCFTWQDVLQGHTCQTT